MTPDHYHSMTDEQLAEWHLLTNEVSRLKLQLAACEATRASDQEVYRIAADVAARALDEYRVEVESLHGLLNAAVVDRQRDRNRLSIVAQHMPAFVADWLATYSPFEDLALTPDTRELRRTARELLTLLEPFE